jgi:hypothetical protein
MENGVIVPIEFSFAIGETFAPPAFLWEIWNFTTCCWEAVNMTGYSAMFIAAQTPFSLPPPVIEATTENGMLQINELSGSTQLILPASYTSNLSPMQVDCSLWVYSSAYMPVINRLFGVRLNIYQSVGSP